MIQRLRLITGLILLVFVAGHLSAHAALLISVQAGTIVLEYVMEPWQTPAGLYLLAGSGLIHFGLNIHALYRRRTWRLASWEAAQHVLGILIPLLLIPHIVANRVMYEVAGTGTNYELLLSFFFSLDPVAGVVQMAAVMVIWAHGMMGLWHWLKVKRGFRRIRDPLLTVAILWPTLSLAGTVTQGIRQRQAIAADPTIVERLLRGTKWTDAKFALADEITLNAIGACLMLYAAVLVARPLRTAVMRRRGLVSLTYDRRRHIPVEPGASVLEALRAKAIPHASLCGGRARCTTCRVLVRDAAGPLPERGALEAAALKRIDASGDVRLACQLRPTSDLSVVPMLPASATMRDVARQTAIVGHEQDITSVFVDLRGSTKLSEHRLPYDTLYVINRFIADMIAAIEETGGRYANFTGDGVMAIYGVDGDTAKGAANALRGANAMLARTSAINDDLKDDLPFPLKIGIGVHTGPAIVGEIGRPGSRQLNAIGDTVNTAARLEALTKEFGQPVVFSEATRGAAGVDTSGNESRDVEIRGRVGRLTVYAVDTAPTSL